MSFIPAVVEPALVEKPDPLRPTPGEPEVEETILWSMHYRQGNNPDLTKRFYFINDMKMARRRADQHCKVMGFILNYVKPFISDIDADEARRNSV